MNHAKLIDSLERFGRVLPAVVKEVSRDDARWKPAPGNEHWSILEVVCHLADEEVDDFPKRLRATIAAPQEKWPPINPGGWAIERQYNEQDLDEMLARFVKDRAESVKWLRSIGDAVDWSIAYQHPKFGAIRAGDLLAAWAAHDALHLRQISKRLFQLVERDAGKFLTRYAGEW